MEYREVLQWILDGKSNKLWDEEENERRIAFVHSLGEKCDSVGWSKLDLQKPEADDILEKIAEFCKEGGWSARGYYTRTYSAQSSDWYRLECPYFKENESPDYDSMIIPGSGREIKLPRIKAYAVSGKAPRKDREFFCVPDSFRTKCIESGISGLRFCWLTDSGKYAGEQYFAAAPRCRIPRMMRDYNYTIDKKAALKTLFNPTAKKAAALGGALPKVAGIFSRLDIQLPVCYLSGDMPASGIGYAYMKDTFSAVGKSEILIRADVAEKMTNAGMLTWQMLEPVYVCGKPIDGYALMDTEELPFPDSKTLADRMLLYDELMKKDRPAKKITQNDALKLLRQAKKNRPQDFKKPLNAKTRDSLDAALSALAPYYGVCGGGYISDEYRLLSPEDSLAATAEHAELWAKEELTAFPDISAVICTCPDGDVVALTSDGTAIRISHEESEMIARWKSLAEFIADAILE